MGCRPTRQSMPSCTRLAATPQRESQTGTWLRATGAAESGGPPRLSPAGVARGEGGAGAATGRA